MKYKVFGHVTVNVYVTVEAETDEEAFEIASDQRQFLDALPNKYGDVKLVGVTGTGESVEADARIVFDDLDEVADDED